MLQHCSAEPRIPFTGYSLVCGQAQESLVDDG